MAIEKPIFVDSLVAAADLSAAANKYKFVKLDSNQKVVLCAAATDKPIGVLQNTPGNGGMAEVMIVGISKVQADAALSVDDLIGTSADGQADVKVPGTDTTEYVVGRVLVGAAAAGELASAYINCLNIHRAS
jgi:hypothetical protein